MGIPRLLLIYSCIFLSLIFHSNSCYSQIAIEWQKCVGSTFVDDVYSIAVSDDNGYVLAGATASTGPDLDYSLIKTDSIGNQQWIHYYGGSLLDELSKVLVSSEGGYLLCGTSQSNDGDVTGAHGSQDGWLVKTDQYGNLVWQTTLGGSDSDYLFGVIQLNNGNYLTAGYTSSNDGSLTGYNPGGNGALWLSEIDTNGVVITNYIYQCSGFLGYGLMQTNDGGYVMTGFAGSPGGIILTNYGSSDLCVVKLDSAFNVQWSKVYGGSSTDRGLSMIQTSDSNYVICGFSASNDIYVSGNHGTSDFWAVKLDSLGNLLWQKCLGGSYYDYDCFSVIENDDGNYIFAGASMGSINGTISHPYDGVDFWIAALDTSGTLLWDRSLGGGNQEYAGAMIKTADGSFVLAGSTISVDFDVSGRIGSPNSSDGWIIKFHDNPNIIKGNAYIDLNSNFIQDPGEQPVPLYHVREINTNNNVLTSSSGSYIVNVLNAGNYEVAIDSLDYCNVVPASHSVSFAGINEVDSLNDFAFQPVFTLFDLSINITATGPIRPGFTSVFHINYQNLGTLAMSGMVNLVHLLNLSYTSSSVPPATIGADTISWDFVNLLPFETRNIDVELTLSPSSILGGVTILIVEIQPIPGDVRPGNNIDSLAEIIVGSYDPNDIVVDITSLLPSQSSNPPFLEYLIRFQNTGTFPATFIEIANPVSSLLDMSTFQLIATSHNADIKYLNHSRNLDFYFDNINLADSLSNESQSHGFVRYRVRPYPGFILSDSIFNNAYIYFDYNQPVSTNVATTVIENPLSITSYNSINQKLLLYPNPSTGMVVLTINSFKSSSIKIQVYNIVGEIVYDFIEQVPAKNYSHELSLNYLPQGVYFIEVFSDSERYVSKFIRN